MTIKIPRGCHCSCGSVRCFPRGFKRLRAMVLVAVLLVIAFTWAQSLQHVIHSMNSPNENTFGELNFRRLISYMEETPRDDLIYQTVDKAEKVNSVEVVTGSSHQGVQTLHLLKDIKQTHRMTVRENRSLNSPEGRADISGDKEMSGDHPCCSWCAKKTNTDAGYFITAVLLVRIYSTDLAKLSTRELHQWLYYLRYAGFEHVYVYDAYVRKNESQKEALRFLIDHGYVTYVDWSLHAYPYSVSGTQERAYQDCLDRYGNYSKWQASFDIDEYPFCPGDTKPNFIQRFVSNFSSERPEVSQITMMNFLFLGKPLNDLQHPFLIDRLKRRTHGPANDLVKPIYKTSHVQRTHVHHHDLAKGISTDAGQNLIRLNHYWGARLQKWGDDTPEILSKTRKDDSVQNIVDNLRNCSHVCLPNKSFINELRWN